MDELGSSPPGVGKAFRIRDWIVQPELNRLVRPEDVVQLEPKHMDVLVFLARHAGEVLTKEQLLEAVWPQQFVAESVLTRAVAEIRKALDDDAQAPRYIETIPKRGYRLIAEVDLEARSARTRPAWLMWAALVIALAVAVWIGSRLAKPGSGARQVEQPPHYNLSHLTTSTAMEVEPSFSPDGRSIAFASNQSGRFEIYVHQFASGAHDIQLTEDGQTNLQPAWSPDGRFIAYHSKGRGGVWLIPALGGEPRQLVDFGSNPAWSPDSSKLVIQSTGVWEIGLGSMTTPVDSTLWLVHLDGPSPRQLTTTDLTPFGQSDPVFSPDGERIFFTDLWDIWSIELSGDDPRPYRRRGRALDPVVSRDGSRVFYIMPRENDYWLCMIKLDDPPEVEEPTRIQRIPARDLALSPDGKRLAFTQYDATSDLWSVELSPETHLPVRDPVQFTRETNRRNTAPRFSPNGQTLVFQKSTFGTESTIWLLEHDGSNPRELHSISSRNVGSPQWSLDGTAVYYRTFRVWNRVDVETRQVEEKIASFERGWHQAEMSRDASQIVFSKKVGGSTDIFVLDIASGAERQITFAENWAVFPKWSPDGQQIAFEHVRGEHTFLMVVSPDGGEARPLTFEPEHSWPWGWSPDGDKIAFAGNREGVWNIYWVSQSEGTTQQLTNHQDGLGAFVRYPTWSPRGDQIVFERYQDTADIWLIELE